MLIWLLGHNKKSLGDRLRESLIATPLIRCLSHDKKSQAILPNTRISLDAATIRLRSVKSSAHPLALSILDGLSS